ncbi:MAG: hypothetical protein ACTHLC_10875 [Rhizobiaceae bacterium]|jgi:hypothetical protein
MNWTKTILREVWGLFVDDGNFALAIAVWLAMAGLALPVLAPAAGWAGIVLFLGLALILLESVHRRAKR